MLLERIVQGYLIAWSAEFITWRCGTSRPSGCAWIVVACSVSYSDFGFLSGASPSPVLSSSWSQSLLNFFGFVLAWPVLNTTYDLAVWVAAIMRGGHPTQLLPKNQYAAVISRTHTKLDVELVLFCYVTSFLLGVIMIPGVLVLMLANAVAPPRPLVAHARRHLEHFYDSDFCRDLCILPAPSDSRHPIVWLVNAVMSHGIAECGKYDANQSESKNNKVSAQNEDDAEDEGGAGAFALFNVVFSSMEPYKLVRVLGRIERQRSNITLVEGAESGDADAIETLVHECVHVCQQRVSTSVLSFLSIYLAQYLHGARHRSFPKPDERFMRGYMNISGERQAYTFEATKPNTFAENGKHFIPSNVRKDFYFQWW